MVDSRGLVDGQRLANLTSWTNISTDPADYFTGSKTEENDREKQAFPESNMTDPLGEVWPCLAISSGLFSSNLSKIVFVVYTFIHTYEPLHLDIYLAIYGCTKESKQNIKYDFVLAAI